MLQIRHEPVQSVAPGVLKWDVNQPRQPKGSEHGGEFAKTTSVSTPDPTHARQAEVLQVRQRFATYSGLSDQDKATVVTDKQITYSLSVRAAMKKKIQMELTERLKNHPAFVGMEPRPPMYLEPVSEWVKSKIDLWAETSGDSDPEAAKMQETTKREFGLTDAVMDHITQNVKVVFSYPQEEARLRAFVRAEYDRTQEWFKSNDITHVSVFRGMGDEHKELGYGFETVTMQPASSWTTDLDTAIDFAEENFEPHKVLTTRVPVSQVLSTCVTGRGCLAEEEIILLGKPQRVRVFETRLQAEVAAHWNKKIWDSLK